MNYSVGITTFSKRYNHVENLVKQIRGFSECDILIAINGNYNSDFDEEYRKKILNLCLVYDKIYPIFFPEQRGLAKLWNTLIINSKQEWVLVLNDDLEIFDEYIFKNTLLSLTTPEMYAVNGIFSHFIVHKEFLHDLGYFDERLLGFGEEDGDMIFRYYEKYGRSIPFKMVPGINNLVVRSRDENIKPAGSDKYSWFNTHFCFRQETPKYIPDPNGILGPFKVKHRKNISDNIQYPYEKFFMDNKHKL